MRWRILGPVEVVVDGAVAPIVRPQQRAVLAYLLLNANRVVSTEQLIEALWGGTPPATARTQVQSCVSQIRRALRCVGVDGALVSQAGGYRLEVDDGDLDFGVFTEQVTKADAAAADGQLAEAARLLRVGLAHWHGTALTGAAGAFVAGTGLPERRLAAYERLAEIELSLGRYGSLATELRPLVALQPLRERLIARFMLALAGCGQQAEALRLYLETRARLNDELGVEPGAELVAAHLRVLRRRLPTVDSGQSRSVRPAQLPADIPAFTGRAAQLRQLSGLLPESRTVVISAIDGAAGVGKTALAVHWAHAVADQFGDGQLYVNLRGFDPGGSAVCPAEAIRGFLDALDVVPQRIPVGLDAQAALYRSVLAGKRMLVVLDNARDAAQVRPLLPATPGCLAVVTSRNRLTSLVAAQGAQTLTLDLLSTDEAWQLLARRIGTDRLIAEPNAVADILSACAGLPLALAIMAARADPGCSLTALARKLREAGGLDAFDHGDPATDIRTVFSWSYLALSQEAAALFRLLGLHPGPDVSAPAAASLAGVSQQRARALLSDLVRANLLVEHQPDRFLLHDLLRAYVTELAHAAVERVAQHRMLDHYLHTAHAAALILEPHRDPITLSPTESGVTPEDLADYDHALTWLTTERGVLVNALTEAARAGFDTHVWQLAWTLAVFLDRRGHWHDAATVHQSAIDAARRLNNESEQARAHRSLAGAYARMDRYEEAHEHLRHALELLGRLGDHTGQARTHHVRAWVFGRQGDHREALGQAQRAADMYRSAGNPAGQANALNTVGWYHAQLGELEQGLAYGRQALALLQQAGNRRGEANTWDSLGFAHHHLGNHHEAITCYQHALRLRRDLGDRYDEADTLTAVGDTHHAAGNPGLARQAWLDALEILEELGHPNADQVRTKLADNA